MRKRILIVKFWALGDILMATPLLTALKRRWPDCEITWMADQAYAPILDDNPLLHDVIAFDSGTWRRLYRYGRFVSYWRMSRRTRSELRSRNFDIVINLTGEKWWAHWFNVAPQRVGLFPRSRPGLLGRLYTWAIPRTREPRLHNTRHYLLPAEALGIPGPYDERMVVGVSPANREAARAFLESQPGFDARKPLLLLHPGTSQASKCWPPAYYAAVSAALMDRYHVVITGSPKEIVLADAIRAALPADAPRPMVAAGHLANIPETAALVERAAAVITGDTSILHIASALGTPLVGIYGSTRPADNAPLFGPQALLFDDTVPCAPCRKAHCSLAGADHLRCQRAVTPARVLAALEALLRIPEQCSVLQ